MKTITIVKTTELVIGQVYYFDNKKESYGKLIKNDKTDSTVFKLKSRKTGGYGISEDKTVSFDYYANDEWILKPIKNQIQPDPIPNDVLKIVEKYGANQVITFVELIKN